MSEEPASQDAAVRAVAAYGLPGAPSLPDHARTADRLDELVTASGQHGLLGLLGAAVRSDDVPLRGSQRERFELSLQAWLAHAVRLEHLVIDAIDCLAAAGIEARVLKGVALAHLVYPDPSWRVFRDVDLLVRACDFSTAVHVLQDGVAVARQEPELRAGFDVRFGKEALLRTDQRLELDLHRTFVE